MDCCRIADNLALNVGNSLCTLLCQVFDGCTAHASHDMGKYAQWFYPQSKMCNRQTGYLTICHTSIIHWRKTQLILIFFLLCIFMSWWSLRFDLAESCCHLLEKINKAVNALLLNIDVLKPQFCSQMSSILLQSPTLTPTPTPTLLSSVLEH